jgi:hypothetical protein
MAAKRPPITTKIKPNRTTAPILITDAKMKQRKYNKNMLEGGKKSLRSSFLKRFLTNRHDMINTKMKTRNRASTKSPSYIFIDSINTTQPPPAFSTSFPR